MRQVLEGNILSFWLEHMRDTECGGWFGQMTGRGELVPDAPRGAILYGRLLWTFSAAYRVLHKDAYLEAATRTKEYIEAYFIDHEQGGVYWSVSADGRPLDTKKQFYAIGFVLYGFSEYARATGDADALHTALQLFDVIERYGRDQWHGGYVEACTCHWQPIADMRLSDKDQNTPKSQNTHLHIIEPYTNLMRALNECHVPATDECQQRLSNALQHLIDIFVTRIFNPSTGHLDLFFDMDWTRLSERVSYGHDIEASWLLDDANQMLHGASLTGPIPAIVQQLAITSQEGILPDGSVAYEGIPVQGPHGMPGGEPVDSERHWWVQAEAIVGLVNIYRRFGDADALQKAARIWDYTKQHLIDHQHGEWFWSILPDGTVNLADDHAGFWKCPYHNSRMCLRLIDN